MQIKIIKSFFVDLTEGKVYDAIEDKNGLWIWNDWKECKLPVNLYQNHELIEYEIVK